jgi:hypothetical protein
MGIYEKEEAKQVSQRQAQKRTPTRFFRDVDAAAIFNQQLGTVLLRKQAQKLTLPV